MSRKNRKQRASKKAQAKNIRAETAADEKASTAGAEQMATDMDDQTFETAKAESLSPGEEKRVAAAIALSDEQKELHGLHNEIKALHEEMDGLLVRMTEHNETIEQLQVQLAGCGAVALGATKEPAKQGDYGWSAAYQDCLDMRLKLDALTIRDLELEQDLATFASKDAELIGFLAIRSLTSRHQMVTFPVIPTFGVEAPENELKKVLVGVVDWSGFRVLKADDQVFFEPYKP